VICRNANILLNFPGNHINNVYYEESAMHNRRAQQTFNPLRVIKKFSLSAFVVFSFVAYALHKPNVKTDVGLSVVTPTPSLMASPQVILSTMPPVDTSNGGFQQTLGSPTQAPAVPTSVPQPAISPTSPPTAAPAQALNSTYKDGTYTGPEVDAFYGLVKVKTVIQHGKIVNVQFLEYPSDRRTSVRINSIALPDLQQEAIQAQSANVDIISGATLTSQGFIMSLQSALDSARG
jgi:uncharacterized protein with FMN-binding domain